MQKWATISVIFDEISPFFSRRCARWVPWMCDSNFPIPGTLRPFPGEFPLIRHFQRRLGPQGVLISTQCFYCGQAIVKAKEQVKRMHCRHVKANRNNKIIFYTSKADHIWSDYVIDLEQIGLKTGKSIYSRQSCLLWCAKGCTCRAQVSRISWRKMVKIRSNLRKLWPIFSSNNGELGGTWGNLG